jgi:hypothetical protein
MRRTAGARPVPLAAGLLVLAGFTSCCGGAITPIGTVGGSLAIQGRDVPGGNGCWTDDDGTVVITVDGTLQFVGCGNTRPW